MKTFPLTETTRMRLVASPSYVASRGMPNSPADLSGHDCLLFHNTHESDRDWWPFLVNGEIQRVLIKPAMLSTSHAVLREAALSGLGLSYQMHDDIAPYVRNGALVDVMQDYAISYPGLTIYHSTAQSPSHAVLLFIEHVKDSVRCEQDKGYIQFALPADRRDIDRVGRVQRGRAPGG